MKYLVLFVLALVGCDNPSPVAVEAPAPKPPPTVLKTIAAKMNPTESGTELKVWDTLTRKGIHTQQVAVTRYYVVFTDGTKMQIPMEEWAIINVGDQKRVSP